MLRPVGPQDVRFLRDMLRHAYHWRLAQDPDLPVYRYVANWGRPGDAGLVTFDATARYGAAWYRLFPADEPGFGFVDEQTPELTIAVVPGARGRGVGHELIDALLDRARADGHAAISLSTEPDHTAFYERHGFERVREDGNAVTMRATL
jgi:ribosomal protein S18 acetylase RimI-like enzyme